jgi:hypothetical protein
MEYDANAAYDADREYDAGPETPPAPPPLPQPAGGRPGMAVGGSAVIGG